MRRPTTVANNRSSWRLDVFQRSTLHSFLSTHYRALHPSKLRQAMTNCGPLLLILSCFIPLAEGRLASSELLGPRCTANCLESMFPDMTLEACGENRACATTCVKVCRLAGGRGEVQGVEPCVREICQADAVVAGSTSILHNCTSSCQFVERSRRVKPGSCPGPDYAQFCRDVTCEDGGCPGERKCCLDSWCRGAQCLDPVNTDYGYPPTVASIQVMGDEESRTLRLDWSDYEPVGDTGKILFLVRVRNTTGYYVTPHSWVHDWRQVALTDLSTLTVPTRPGWWSEFQVATVNKHGSRGFSSSSRSKIERLQTPPAPPDPPTRVVTGVTQTLPSTLTVNNISFTPSLSPDLPIANYTVSLSCSFDPTAAAAESPTIVIPASACTHQSCILPLKKHNLQFPCSPFRFFVSITAVCVVWDKTSPNTTAISTDFLIDQKSSDPFLPSDEQSTNPIRIAENYEKFSRESLSVTLFWDPADDAATFGVTSVRGYCDGDKNWFEDRQENYRETSGTKLDLELDYSCEYAFQLTAYSSSVDVLYTSSKSYMAPTCQQVAERSLVEPSSYCRGKSELGFLERISYTFVGKNITSLTVNALIQWRFDQNFFRHRSQISSSDVVPNLEVLVYRMHPQIGIIDYASSPCYIHLYGQSGMLPNSIDLLNQKLQSPCHLHYNNTYRFAARVVYRGGARSGVRRSEEGPWRSILLDTSMISFFDVYPPWKQEQYRALGINTYFDALRYEENEKKKKKKEEKTETTDQYKWYPPISNHNYEKEPLEFYYESNIIYLVISTSSYTTETLLVIFAGITRLMM